MAGEFAGIAQGLNQAINQYLGLSIQNMQQGAASARDMEQKKELMRYEQELKPKAFSLPARNLREGNPKIAPFLSGVADDAEVPVDEVNKLSSLLPKDTGAGSEDGFTSIEDFSALAEFLGHDKAAVEKLKKDHPKGIPNRNVNSLLVTPMKGKVTDAKVADLTMKLLEFSGEASPEAVGATSKELSKILQKGPGRTALKSDAEYNSATIDALKHLDGLVDGGLSPDKALIKLGEDLSETFDHQTSLKIMWNARIKAKQAQNQGIDIAQLIQNESNLKR